MSNEKNSVKFKKTFFSLGISNKTYDTCAFSAPQCLFLCATQVLQNKLSFTTFMCGFVWNTKN